MEDCKAITCLVCTDISFNFFNCICCNLLQTPVLKPGSSPAVMADPPPPVDPPPSLPWLTEWRLRAALTSTKLFTDLNMQLAVASARAMARYRGRLTTMN